MDKANSRLQHRRLIKPNDGIPHRESAFSYAINSGSKNSHWLSYPVAPSTAHFKSLGKGLLDVKCSTFIVIGRSDEQHHRVVKDCGGKSSWRVGLFTGFSA